MFSDTLRDDIIKKNTIRTSEQKRNIRYFKNEIGSTKNESNVLHSKIIEQMPYLQTSNFQDKSDTSGMKYSKSTETSIKITEFSNQITSTDSHVVLKRFTESDSVTRAFMFPRTDFYDENMMTESDVPEAKSQGMYSSRITVPSYFSFDSTSDENEAKNRLTENVILKICNRTNLEPKALFETNLVYLKQKQTHRRNKSETQNNIPKNKVSISPTLQTEISRELNLIKEANNMIDSIMSSVENKSIIKMGRSRRNVQSKHYISLYPTKKFYSKILEDLCKNENQSRMRCTSITKKSSPRKLILSSLHQKPYVYNVYSYFITNSSFRKTQMDNDSQDQDLKFRKRRKNLLSVEKRKTVNANMDCTDGSKNLIGDENQRYL